MHIGGVRADRSQICYGLTEEQQLANSDLQTKRWFVREPGLRNLPEIFLALPSSSLQV